MTQTSTSAAHAGDGSIRIEEYGDLVVLRSAQAPAPVGGLDELVHALRSAGDRTVTLLSDPNATEEPDFWPRVGQLLDSLRASGHTTVRLALTGAGEEWAGRPAPARRIADNWAINVEAPAGPLLVAAGGSLYAPVGPDGRGGWLGFAPGATPVPLGARCPAPVWQSALDAVPGEAADGYVIEHIPAGVSVRPGWQAEAASATDTTAYHTIAVDPTCLTVVGDGPPGDRALWPALELLLDSLPHQVRASTALLLPETALTPDGVHAPGALQNRYGVHTVRALPAPHERRGGSVEARPRKDVVPAGRPARATVPSPPPRTTADPLATPDLTGAWEHLGRGRETVGATLESPAPDLPPGSDLDVAWEYLSRHPETEAASPDAQAPRSGTTRPDSAQRVRPVSVRPSLRPGYRSGPAEHAALRLLAGPAWERHAPVVARALGRLPALADEERQAAEAELTALRLYLDEPDGLLDHRALAAACYGRDDRLMPFAACLVSALRRLPTHRGAVLRGAGSALPAEVDPETDPLRPGTVLRDRAPLSGVPAAGKAGWPRGPRYAIWSVTGRLARRLFDDPAEEVVFAPGTPFVVLDVRRTGSSPVVLLRELPASGGAPAHDMVKGTQAELGEAYRAALAGLDEALRGRNSPRGSGGWPERCVGPVGEGP
ncbi:hypothetical protein AB0N07_44465 [Streptomyces sp. NPDC051172]|uniref:hypothetical protein n=1 Tax=Streptomyces sp. NPDC051172 TaxID=3155796 RepID=UPI003426154E